jgi:hypothetical protein
MYEKNDPWRRISTTNMVKTVSLESRAVVSASGASVKSVIETRFALKDITTSEKKMVFTKTTMRKIERFFEELELILRV